MKIYYLLITLLVLGCSSSATRLPAIEPPEEKPSLEMSRDVHWMRNSAEYQAIVLQTYRLAGLRLRELVADKKPGSWAVSVDADETVIDSTEFNKEWDLEGRKFTVDLWDIWISGRKDPLVPGAVAFLKLVHSLGGHIVFITNRSEFNCPDTEANLRAFDAPFDVVLCRGEDNQKELRWEAVEKGETSAGLPPLEIVMWLGDNIQDFPGLDQSLRQESAEAFSKFGDRYFTFPNATYGSWQANPHD